MGALGTFLEVSGDGDREGLHAAIWECVRAFLAPLLTSGPYWDVTSYLIDVSSQDSWGARGDGLHWMFPDYGGNCTRSKYMWTHWTQLAIAAEWDAIERLAAAHGLAITSKRRSLDIGGDQGFLELRGKVWLIMEDSLVGDGEHLAIEGLDADERARVEAARAACACAPCRLLAPSEPAAPPTFTSELERLAAETSTAEGLLALITAAGEPRAIQPLVEKCAMRVDGAWDAVMAALPTLDSRARANAMFALVAARRTPEHTAWLLDRIRTALATEQDDAACALAVLAGRFRGHPELVLSLARVLERISIPEALRLAAVEGLDQSRSSGPMPEEVRELLQREYDRGGKAAFLADALLRSW